jgi:hypothetical protein
MSQQFILIGNIELASDRDLLLEGRVEAYDRDLPSLEQRGSTPHLLGQSPIDSEILQFRIEFTSDRTGSQVKRSDTPIGIHNPNYQRSERRRSNAVS